MDGKSTGTSVQSQWLNKLLMVHSTVILPPLIVFGDILSYSNFEFNLVFMSV